MIWQDMVLMIGGFAFYVALLPSVIGQNKPEKSTCLMTGSILSVFVVVYITLGLVWAATSTSLTAFLWFILFVQTFGRKK